MNWEELTAESHFLSDGKIFDQVNEVAMGSPLAPVLANLFMGHHEKVWIDNFANPKPIVYKSYVDDTLFNMFI